MYMTHMLKTLSVQIAQKLLFKEKDFVCLEIISLKVNALFAVKILQEYGNNCPNPKLKNSFLSFF